MRWPGIEAIYGEFLRKTPVFGSEKRWEDLHTRVIEHVSYLVDSVLEIPAHLIIRIYALSRNITQELLSHD